MRRNKIALGWIVILATALAGCSEDGPEPTTDENPSAPGAAAGTSLEPVNNTPPPSLEPVTASCTVTSTSAFVAGARGLCQFSETGVDPADYRSALIEMAWGTSPPGLVEAELSIESNECNQGATGTGCAIASASGEASPLNVTLDADDLADNAADEMFAVAYGFGAYAEQTFTLHISLFEVDTIPAGYTAVS